MRHDEITYFECTLRQPHSIPSPSTMINCAHVTLIEANSFAKKNATDAQKCNYKENFLFFEEMSHSILNITQKIEYDSSSSLAQSPIPTHISTLEFNENSGNFL